MSGRLAGRIRPHVAALGSLFLFATPAAARKKPKLPEPPPLTQEYVHKNGLFRFLVPEDWKVGNANGDPDAVQAVGQGVVIRFIYRPGEAGYDALHGSCLYERLIFGAERAGIPSYEYDYEEGSFGNRRFLESVQNVDYGTEVMGHRKWRHRNLTVVGAGHSLCMIAFAPESVWKKSSAARSVLEAVLQNVKFKE